MGRSNKVWHRLRLLFFKRTILLLIYHQFLQFWYQCIKKTSIYHIIGNFPPNCHRNTRKTDEVYDFLQSAKLTCMDDLWTQKRRSEVSGVFTSLKVSPDFHSAVNIYFWRYNSNLNRRGFPFSESKAGPLCGLVEIVDFVRFPCHAAAIWGKIADNVINGSLLDTLVPKLKKLMMN